MHSDACLPYALLLFLASTSPAAAGNSWSGSSRESNKSELPKAISSSDWTSIQAQIKAAKYRSYPQEDGGFSSTNPAQGWRIHYAVDGTTTITTNKEAAEPYHISLRLISIGYQDLVSVGRPSHTDNEQTAFSYQWNQHLREIWTNDESMLEQWFVLEQRPGGDSSQHKLTLEMALDTDLLVIPQTGGLQFSNSNDIDIRYNKLIVWDTTGQILPAQMVATQDTVKLLVDDSQAIYPLTIDPGFQQQSYLKASNTGAEDEFGFSVAISGDTLVVGAYLEDSSAVGVNNPDDDTAIDAGAAYVFTRSGASWTQQAYLKASNTEAEDRFGHSVAISGDTIVVDTRLKCRRSPPHLIRLAW
jgi:hypothetical protein